MKNIKDMVKNKKVQFVHFRAGELIYKTECGFEFPIPVSDTGNASFLPEDNAIKFMRWIRKQLELQEN